MHLSAASTPGAFSSWLRYWNRDHFLELSQTQSIYRTLIFFRSDRLESRDCFIYQGPHLARIDNFILFDPRSIYCLLLSLGRAERHPLFPIFPAQTHESTKMRSLCRVSIQKTEKKKKKKEKRAKMRRDLRK